MTRLVVAATLAALLAAASSGLAASTPSPAAIRDSIKREGAKATIADLAKADQWDAVSDRMDSGSADWISLAPLLAPGSDAGSAEDLGISLAFSLPKNPGAVLAALDPANGHIIGANRVCGLPFIEDTVSDLPAYRLKATRAVQQVKDTKLASARTACLAALAAAR